MDPLLGRIASTVSSAHDLEGLTRPLLELLEMITGLESTYLTTIDTVRGVQHVLYARNAREMQIPEGITVPWDDTLCKRALDENRMFTDDVANCWADSEAARALGIQTYLSQPVRLVDGHVYGTLCAAGARRASVSDDVIKVLGLFAQLIAYQVERERMLETLRQTNRELESHALTDPLTGIANRRALCSELQRMLVRARRERHSFQVAFIDLDGFKTINDRYGHEVGDRFLMHIASRLAASVRPCDFVARYGGDEFVVLVANSKLDELKTRLEQLTSGRFASNDLIVDYSGASIGVVVAEPDETDVEALLARADAAMYAAKQSRRAAPAACAA